MLNVELHEFQMRTRRISHKKWASNRRELNTHVLGKCCAINLLTLTLALYWFNSLTPLLTRILLLKNVSDFFSFFFWCEIPIAWCAIQPYSTWIQRQQAFLWWLWCSHDVLACKTNEQEGKKRNTRKRQISLIKMWFWTVKFASFCWKDRFFDFSGNFSRFYDFETIFIFFFLIFRFKFNDYISTRKLIIIK